MNCYNCYKYTESIHVDVDAIQIGLNRSVRPSINCMINSNKLEIEINPL